MEKPNLDKIGGKSLEEWKETFLKHFKNFHDDYIDEIPDHIVHGNNPENHKYKVRGNWFAAVRNSLDNAAHLNMFPEEFNQEWKNFFIKWGDKKPETDEDEIGVKNILNTKEEIDTVNSFLLKAQEIISNK